MLARANRLRRERDINKVYAKGVFGGGGDITVKALRNNTSITRIAVVVSKKISKKAVIRNRIRRRIHGALEQGWQTVRPGYDIVVSARADISEMGASQLLTSLVQALSRAGAIQAGNHKENHV